MRTIRPSLEVIVLCACSLLALAASSSAFAADRVVEKHERLTPATSRVGTPGGEAGKEQPVRVRTATPRHVSDGARPDPGKVNINTADVKELMTLTGVGRKVAERIVEYRDNHGPFKKADEVRKVEGVGTGVWEKNRERIVTR